MNLRGHLYGSWPVAVYPSRRASIVFPNCCQISRFRVEIKILGSGPEEEDLKRRFGNTKPSSHTVELVGRVDDVVPYLDWSDAAFMPSRKRTQPCVSVWEAWARGRPVVAAHLPAFEDLRTSGPVLTFTGAASLRSALGVVSSDEYRDFAYSMGLQASRTMTTRSEIVARIQS